MRTDGNFDPRVVKLPYEWKSPIINVVDTMDIVKAYFDDEGITYTGADLVAAVALIFKEKKNAE